MISYDKQLKYIFFICLAVGFYFQMLNLANPLLDQYGFRQTQTAITSYWFLKEGFQWAYQTPVFGIPWSVPMEFPLYQYLVYIFVKIFNIENLDLAGRIVSIAFYYALMYPLWQILKILEVNKIAILYIFIILVTSPIFIFWSRTFMIESAGLYFTLMFIMYVLKYDTENSISLKILSLIFIFGTFAILTKITTLLVGFIFIFLYLLFYGRLKTLFSKKNIVGILVVGIVITIGLAWNEFANSIKASNPLSSFVVSSNLTKWNFGTLAQRLDFANYYQQLFVHMKNNISYLLLLVIFIPGLLFCKVEYKKLMLIGFLTFIIAFMTLFNLYKVHNYYWYANSVFVVISLGLLVYFISEKINKYSVKIILLILAICINIFGYYSYYYKTQTNDFRQNKTIIIGDIVKNFTKENDIIITTGLDWDSQQPYYAQRKAIMLRSNFNLTSKEFIEVYNKSTINTFVGAILSCDGKNIESDISKIFNFEEFGKIEVEGCNIYIRDTTNSQLEKYFLDFHLFTEEERVFFNNREKLNINAVDLNILNITNAIKDKNIYKAQNNDMHLSFKIPDECLNRKNIGLEIDLTRDFGGFAQVFYKRTNENFSERNSIKKNFKDGRVNMKFLVNMDNLYNIRIDPTEKIEDVEIHNINVLCEDK